MARKTQKAKPLILLEQGPTLMTSFNPNYLLRDTTSKYSHLGGAGKGFSIEIGGKGTVNIQSIIFTSVVSALEPRRQPDM